MGKIWRSSPLESICSCFLGAEVYFNLKYLAEHKSFWIIFPTSLLSQRLNIPAVSIDCHIPSGNLPLITATSLFPVLCHSRSSLWYWICCGASWIYSTSGNVSSSVFYAEYSRSEAAGFFKICFGCNAEMQIKWFTSFKYLFNSYQQIQFI